MAFRTSRGKACHACPKCNSIEPFLHIGSIVNIRQRVKIRNSHSIHIAVARHIAGEDHIAAVRAKARMYVGLLDVHAAAVLAKRLGAIKAAAIPAPQAHHLTAIAHN